MSSSATYEQSYRFQREKCNNTILLEKEPQSKSSTVDKRYHSEPVSYNQLCDPSVKLFLYGTICDSFGV